MRLNILSPGAKTPNGAGFIFPFWIFNNALRQQGVQLSFFNRVNDQLCDCDALLIDSKFHRTAWAKDTEKVLSQFANWSERTHVIYFDTTDSTGSLQTELLPHVDIYAKAQLLKDKTKYGERHYAERIFADYYHQEFGFTDTAPSFSKPETDPKLLKKLRLSWNSGMADHSFAGPFIGLCMRRLNLPILARFATPIAAARDRRTTDVSCRFGNSYNRGSIRAQRLLTTQVLNSNTSKLRRLAYLKEMASSKIVISPFGLGEITLKDFETFLCGAMLLKPDMDHMETWPNFFVSDVTIKTHSWNLEDLQDKIAELLRNNAERQEIAENGQRVYQKYTTGPDAAELFTSHFLKLVKPGQ